MKVEITQEVIDESVKILRENNLKRAWCCPLGLILEKNFGVRCLVIYDGGGVSAKIKDKDIPLGIEATRFVYWFDAQDLGKKIYLLEPITLEIKGVNALCEEVSAV